MHTAPDIYNQEDALFSDGKEIGDLRRNGDFVERYIDISFDPRLFGKFTGAFTKFEFDVAKMTINGKVVF